MTISGEESRDWKEILVDWVRGSVAVVDRRGPVVICVQQSRGFGRRFPGIDRFRQPYRRSCPERAESGSTGPTDCERSR